MSIQELFSIEEFNEEHFKFFETRDAEKELASALIFPEIVFMKISQYFDYKFNNRIKKGESVRNALFNTFTTKYQHWLYPQNDNYTASNDFHKYSCKKMIDIYLDDKSPIGIELRECVQTTYPDLHESVLKSYQ